MARIRDVVLPTHFKMAMLLTFCWTNTLPNLSPWGASRALLGNNPLDIAVPPRNRQLPNRSASWT